MAPSKPRLLEGRKLQGTPGASWSLPSGCGCHNLVQLGAVLPPTASHTDQAQDTWPGLLMALEQHQLPCFGGDRILIQANLPPGSIIPPKWDLNRETPPGFCPPCSAPASGRMFQYRHICHRLGLVSVNATVLLACGLTKGSNGHMHKAQPCSHQLSRRGLSCPHLSKGQTRSERQGWSRDPQEEAPPALHLNPQTRGSHFRPGSTTQKLTTLCLWG